MCGCLTAAGMTAALTNYLVDRIHSSSPFVIKYIPYGGLSEVSRRFTVTVNSDPSYDSGSGSSLITHPSLLAPTL